jgi:hypothetical protein
VAGSGVGIEDPEWAARELAYRRSQYEKNAAALARRKQDDPDYAEKQLTRKRLWAAKKRWEDPLWAEKQRADLRESARRNKAKRTAYRVARQADADKHARDLETPSSEIRRQSALRAHPAQEVVGSESRQGESSDQAGLCQEPR